jgi:hypothetical protein
MDRAVKVLLDKDKYFDFPRNMKLLVGLGGRHYHLSECPGTHEEYMSGYRQRLDYVSIEVPRILAEKAVVVAFLGTNYEPCPMCIKGNKELTPEGIYRMSVPALRIVLEECGEATL